VLVHSESDFTLYVDDIPLIFEGIGDPEVSIAKEFQSRTEHLVKEILAQPESGFFKHGEKLIRDLQKNNQLKTDDIV
jgi:hypothetical protein